jgi:transketolase N-terminal domain/subunit
VSAEVEKTATGWPMKPRPEGVEPCGGCGGHGLYFSGGAVVNGVYTGKTGDCYRCSGKGYQTDADRKRNRYYDRHVRRVHL